MTAFQLPFRLFLSSSEQYTWKLYYLDYLWTFKNVTWTRWPWKWLKTNRKMWTASFTNRPYQSRWHCQLLTLTAYVHLAFFPNRFDLEYHYIGDCIHALRQEARLSPSGVLPLPAKNQSEKSPFYSSNLEQHGSTFVFLSTILVDRPLSADSIYFSYCLLGLRKNLS